MSLSSAPESPSSPSLNTTNISEYDLQLERRAVRKLDFTILPIMALFYLVSFLVCFFLLSQRIRLLISLQDRSNIGEKIFGYYEVV